MKNRLGGSFRIWIPVAAALALPAAPAPGGVVSNGVHTMEARVTGGGAVSFSGGYEMVTLVSGPVAPEGSTGTGFDAYSLPPETFAVPVALTRFSLE